MKSGFDIATILPMPRSSGVTVPSVSCPTMMKPFSARNSQQHVEAIGDGAALLALRPDRLEHARAHSRRATLTSKPSSPVKLTRASRVGTPQMQPSRTLRCGNAAAERSTPSTSGARMSRAFGPLIAIVANCSVIEVELDLQIRPFGLQIVLHHREDVRGARVVVVMWKRSSASRMTTPSS